MSLYFTQPMRWLGASLFIAYSAGTAIAAEQQASVASKWNSVALNEIVLDNSAPYKNARQLATLNLSLYNAIEAVKQKHELPGPGIGQFVAENFLKPKRQWVGSR